MTCSWTDERPIQPWEAVQGLSLLEREGAVTSPEPSQALCDGPGLAWEPFEVAAAGEVTDSRLWTLQMVEESWSTGTIGATPECSAQVPGPLGQPLLSALLGRAA